MEALSPYRFWSSDDLTGNQTSKNAGHTSAGFWSSDDLTGNQTYRTGKYHRDQFWSSDDLTGNQTSSITSSAENLFWSSDDLTGNQTEVRLDRRGHGFWSSDDLTGNQTVPVFVCRASLRASVPVCRTGGRGVAVAAATRDGWSIGKVSLIRVRCACRTGALRGQASGAAAQWSRPR